MTTWCTDCLAEGVELYPVKVRRPNGEMRWNNMCLECKEKRERARARKPLTPDELEEEQARDARLAERMKSRSAIPVVKVGRNRTTFHEFSITPSMDTYQYMTSKGTQGYRFTFLGWKSKE